MMGVPDYKELLGPTLHALRRLGGKAQTSEIDATVADDLGLTQEQLEEVRSGKATNREFTYQMAWSRTNLKKAGLIEHVSRGTWALTDAGHKAESIDPDEVKRKARDAS